MTNKSVISLKRKRYYTMIYTYQERRKDLRDKLGLHSDEFKKQKDTYDRKIKTWKEQIRRIDKLVTKIHSIERAIVAFTGIKIRGQVYTPKNRCSDELRRAKAMYYKFGLENGIRGKELREYIGVPKTIFNQPYAYRKEFTNSFKSKPENKKIWMQFKDFYFSEEKHIKINRLTHHQMKNNQLKTFKPH